MHGKTGAEKTFVKSTDLSEEQSPTGRITAPHREGEANYITCNVINLLEIQHKGFAVVID